MSKRKLKRKLNLLQLVMLGTAGTIAAEIFVLTGHAAALVGPAAVLAMIIAGLFSYSIALNYCELATMYPVTGGGVTYVREAWGSNLLTFLVGSLDCLSSTFYAALSAVGFAYSLKVFIPALPVVPTALVTIMVFILLNILDVSNVGNVQIVLGSILLLCLGVFIVGGFVLPGGFKWSTFTEGGFFIHRGFGTNTAKILNTIALVYCSYIGYEVIAHDAEEAENPSRNLPIAILVSITLCAAVYVLTTLVTLGTVSWRQVAGSETALTDVVVHFLPRWGVPMMVVAGIIATLTSVNAALLSGIREAFTLARTGLWPRFMSRLSRFRTPHLACWVIGGISCLVAAVGLVDFLSYVSSSGFLFVLFWSNLAMVRLRKLYPNAVRPFRAPLFPLTPLVAILACFVVISFASLQSILFGVGVLAACTVYYYTYRPVTRLFAKRTKALGVAKDCLLVPVANPRTAESLVHLASMVAQASEDTSICVLTIVPSSCLSKGIAARLAERLGTRQRALLSHLAAEVQRKNIPFYTKFRTAPSVAEGILEEVRARGAVKLIIMGWPGPLNGRSLAENPVKVVLQRAPMNVAVLLDRGLSTVRNILVPVGGGPHSRLAVRVAFEVAEQERAEVTAFRCLCGVSEIEEMEDQLLLLREIIEDELGDVPPHIATRIACADSVPKGILTETTRRPYDLVVMGASEEWALKTRLFGSIDDWIVERVQCSVLLVRAHEPAPISWIRRQTKRIERDNGEQIYQPTH